MISVVTLTRGWILTSDYNLMNMTVWLALIAIMMAATPLMAQDDDAAAEMARKAQDPLGSVRALMTDNTIAFDDPRDGSTA